MKPIQKQIIINVIITLISSSIIYFGLFRFHQQMEISRISKGIALHQQQIETFINDTHSTVENLATVISLTQDDSKINSAITTIKNQEPKYKNIYVLNKNSQIVNASSPKMIGRTLKSFNYFNKNININNVAISGKETDMNGIEVIYISKFIPDQTSKINVVIEIDINNLLSIIDSIQPNSTITLKDFDNHIIFQSNHPIASSLSKSIKFQNIPWNLTISSNEHVYMTALKEIFFLSFVISIVTAMIQLLLFSRQEQNEKRRLQEEINAQKKELTGMLAANTAHEIKNPLTAVKGFIGLIELKYDPQHENPHFNIIKQELDRINDIVGQFLLLGKPTTALDTTIEVRQVVKEVLDFMKYDLEINNIKVISSYSDTAAHTKMSTDQLKQVIINLLQNAKDAIPAERNGIIEVKVIVHEAIFITVRDNGVGMSKQGAAQIFEPFYTTKSTGTGLGLPVTKNMIEAHGGTIEVESEPNIGTTFIITMPCADD